MKFIEMEKRENFKSSFSEMKCIFLTERLARWSGYLCCNFSKIQLKRDAKEVVVSLPLPPSQ